MRHHLSKRRRLALKRSGLCRALRGLILGLLVCTAQVCFGQTEEEQERQNREAKKITAISELQSYYATQDPQYANTVARLPNVQSALDHLRSQLTTSQAAHPGRFANCVSATDSALRSMGLTARQNNEVSRYGFFGVILSNDPSETGGRAKLLALCTADLEATPDAELAGTLRLLDSAYQEMDDILQQVDQLAARRKAEDAYQRTAETNVCEPIDYEKAGYTVKSIRIEDPFAFLRWVGKREERAADQIKTIVGKPFKYTTATGEALDTIERENFVPDTNERLQIRVEFVSVQNCSDQSLDLVYQVYSTRILPVLSAAPEARVTEKESPQTAAGQTDAIVPASKPVFFIPTGGYDSTNKLFGGGRLVITPENLWKLPFKSVIVQGQGSSTMKSISAALTGSTDSPHGWLAHAEWLLNYTNFSLPTDAGQIKGAHLSAQFSGMTRAFQNGNFTFRFGGLLEGGNRQSTIRSVPLTPDTLGNAGFGSLKLYAGLDSRFPHNVLSVSYGLALGSIGPAARVDWRKHVGDLRHEFWYPLGDHRILDLESRFTFGRIQTPGKIPLSERFFGGNNEEFFIPGDTWQIRANPVIRAIPGSRFYRTADGAGGERFFSYNLTAAYAVWRKTLVPQELTTDPDFNSELQGAITTVTSTLQNYYASKDPHYLNVVAQLPAVQSALNDLKEKVTASQTAHPGQFPNEFKACLKAVGGAIRRVRGASDPQGGDQYGLIEFLLSEDPDEIQLAKVNQACERDLNTGLGDPSIRTANATVDGLRSKMLGDFNGIDQKQAVSRAKSDMTFTRRTLDTLFKEVNIYSISPVFVFDVAKLSGERAGFGGVRYGPGAGVRLELATVAHFTVGYAWNTRQGPGEGPGTVFFSIGVRDLFH